MNWPTLNDGGPAFPVDHQFVNPDATPYQLRTACGMSIRDWFAGQIAPQLVYDWCECDPEHYKTLAINAYKLADAMIEARSKQPLT
jgi:hypothetical protein